MSETRITGADVRNGARMVETGPWMPGWFRQLAEQVDADARRLADLEAENGRQSRLVAELQAEMDWLRSCHATAEKARKSHWDELVALRSDAAEYRALQAVIAHPMNDRGPWPLKGGGWESQTPDNMYQAAPTPSALLAKLDALAEARKPKAEVWRLRYECGAVSTHSWPNPLGAKVWGSERPGPVGHTPVREVRNAAGDILLLREGRPIPTEGGPWT